MAIAAVLITTITHTAAGDALDHFQRAIDIARGKATAEQFIDCTRPIGELNIDELRFCIAESRRHQRAR
jgi:hypothetical protein